MPEKSRPCKTLVATLHPPRPPVSSPCRFLLLTSRHASQVLDMRIQKVTPQLLRRHVLRTADHAFTARRTTPTLERLLHFPLGARVEESQLVTRTQTSRRIPVLVRPGRDADLDDGFFGVRNYVELQARLAAVVDVQKVAVQLDVLRLGDLHGRPALRRRKRQRRTGQAGEQRPGGERDDGDAV